MEPLAERLTAGDARDLLGTMIELVKRPDVDDADWILRELRREICEYENALPNTAERMRDGS